MSSLMHRAPGVVGAIFDHPTVMSSVVCDGIHADFAAVRIAKKHNERKTVLYNRCGSRNYKW